MIQLKLRTEYSFRQAFGHIEESIKCCEGNAVGIADNGTWGFVKFAKYCKKHKKKPIYGVQIAVVDELSDKRKNGFNTMTFLAKNPAGLKEVYKLCSKANEKDQFYYVPRLAYDQIPNSSNLIILSGTSPNIGKIQHLEGLFLEASPSNKLWVRSLRKYNLPVVAVSDVYYPRPEDRKAYEMVISDYKKTGVQYIADEYILKAEFDDDWHQSWFDNSDLIASLVEEFELPKAENVKFKVTKTLEEICIEGAVRRKIDLNDPVYKARLERELAMIKQKGFEDYFYVLSDMILEAKKTMLVGVARGSSAGSLVCYLTGITDVDPIPHGLIFERFIDITRADLPDIDVDFPDVKRDGVIKYLEKKYGKDAVGHIGTVSQYKPKSVLGEVAKTAGIPAWEIKDLKDAIIERSGGDARAAMCIQDTFDTLEIGKTLLAKYPILGISSKIEGHSRHSGVHAAGIIVLNDSLTNYCSVNREGTAMLDKKDAEHLNILKIDVLGLRTLSVIEDCLNQIGMDKQKLLELDLNDKKVFDATFNKGNMSGIFQFEGYALKSITNQMPVEHFDDIVAITTLARPGPLHSGGTTIFINRRTGKEPVSYLHELAEESTKDTFGVIIYQEQVMQVGRSVGKLSWEDVSELRKAMSKSLGDEFFSGYWEKFKKGAIENGIEEDRARGIWDSMCTFGSWAFNKSHAVSYGIISYWCAWLKTYYPLEYAAASLRNNKDTEQTIKLLRELVNEGLNYKAFDAELSEANWSIKKGMLLGGLIGVKGIGEKLAEDIVARREDGRGLTLRQQNLLANPEIDYTDVFEVGNKFKHIYDDPEKYNIQSGNVCNIKEIQENGVYIFIGKLKDKNLRDLNEYGNVVKRGGKLIANNNLFLNMTFEDDSDSIICSISRWDYPKFGKGVVEEGKIGDIYLIKGRIRDSWRKINVSRIKRIYSKDSGYIIGCGPDEYEQARVVEKEEKENAD